MVVCQLVPPGRVSPGKPHDTSAARVHTMLIAVARAFQGVLNNQASYASERLLDKLLSGALGSVASTSRAVALPRLFVRHRTTGTLVPCLPGLRYSPSWLASGYDSTYIHCDSQVSCDFNQVALAAATPRGMVVVIVVCTWLTGTTV